MIDIKETREWFAKLYQGDASLDVMDRAKLVLDELEETREESDEQRRRAWGAEEKLGFLTAEIKAMQGERSALFGMLKEADASQSKILAELAEGRAQSIRMLAAHLDGAFTTEAAILVAAEIYDRIAEVPIPPPKKRETDPEPPRVVHALICDSVSASTATKTTNEK